MAKQQIVHLDNGATLIYQKQGSFNGHSFVIGFRGGAQLDGKYAGISHLLEHLFFRASDNDLSKNILNEIFKHSLNQNAFTSKDSIAVTFSATQNNTERALENCVNMLTDNKFTPEQVAQEIEIVKQEIKIYENDYENVNCLSEVFDQLSETNDSAEALDILGNSRSLSKITPELLTTYMDRYFNLNNMIISVTSNKSINEIIQLCNNHIFNRFKEATSQKFIIPSQPPTTYKDQNISYVYPNPNKSNVEIYLLLRERNKLFSEDISREYAYDAIEEMLMNPIGGILYDTFRRKNNLVYSYGLSNYNLGTAKYKVFNATTSRPKMRKTINVLCERIRKIAYEGFSQESFETVKKIFLDVNNAKLQKFKNYSAISNYEDYIQGYKFIDYKLVQEYIKNTSYEDFNDYITSVYRMANVSIALDGNFDERNCYSIIEIAEMLGNTAYSNLKYLLNKPKMEVMPIEEEKLNPVPLISSKNNNNTEQEVEIDYSGAANDLKIIDIADNEKTI